MSEPAPSRPYEPPSSIGQSSRSCQEDAAAPKLSQSKMENDVPCRDDAAPGARPHRLGEYELVELDETQAINMVSGP